MRAGLFPTPSVPAGWVLEWHWLAVLGCGPPTLMLLLMWCMPETPRFLLSQHKLLEARSAMCFLWGSEADWEEPPIGAEYQVRAWELQLGPRRDGAGPGGMA